jgi:hypothetical protein
MIEHFCKWLESTPLSVYCAATPWIVPTVQSIHILGVCVAFASMSMLSMRLVGVWARQRPVSAIAVPMLSRLWPVLAVLLFTGAVMVLAEPERELLNRMFLLKMTLVGVAAVTGWALRGSLIHRRQRWDISPGRAAVRSLGIALFVLWGAIIVCGRWIAYTQ